MARLRGKLDELEQQAKEKHAEGTRALEDAKAANREKFDAAVADYEKAKQDFLQFKNFHKHSKYTACEQKLEKLERLHWEHHTRERTSLGVIYIDHAKFCERPTWKSNIDPVKNKIHKLNTCAASERPRYEGELATARRNAEEFLEICEAHNLTDTTKWQGELTATLATVKPAPQPKPQPPTTTKLEEVKAKVHDARQQAAQATKQEIDKVVAAGDSLDALDAREKALDAYAGQFAIKPAKTGKPSKQNNDTSKITSEAPKSRWAAFFDCSNWCGSKKETASQPAPATDDARAKLLAR